jgi:uncharacterized membrane protein
MRDLQDPSLSANPDRAGGPTATVRVARAAAVGAAAAIVVAIVGPWWLIPLTAWDITALVFIIGLCYRLAPLDAAGTAARSQREDPRRSTADLLLLGASLVSLLAVGLVLVRASQQQGLDKGLLVGVSVLSIVLAWGVVHTVYTLRYARLYYRGSPGGVSFNEDDPPVYLDFAYLALTIGMTFQVSDTDLQSKEIRRLALRHALISYVFGALIIATTVNLVAGLGK